MWKRLKALKSTILGLAFIVFAGFLLVCDVTENLWILGALFIVGLGLLFSGDKFIERLEDVVFGRISKKENDGE
jgi:hypothetical protein